MPLPAQSPWPGGHSHRPSTHDLPPEHGQSIGQVPQVSPASQTPFPQISAGDEVVVVVVVGASVVEVVVGAAVVVGACVVVAGAAQPRTGSGATPPGQVQAPSRQTD